VNHYAPGEEIPSVESPNLLEPQETTIVDETDIESDFVHMGREHDSLPVTG
jgi:hypothetical protein